MTIYVDGDACPVLKNITKIAKEKKIEMIVICDFNHDLKLEYGQLILVDQSSDQADFAIINKVKENDILVTQDYGLAALALAKKTKVINHFGVEYTNENIEMMLYTRYQVKKSINSKQKNHIRGPKKRTEIDNRNFETGLNKLLSKHLI